MKVDLNEIDQVSSTGSGSSGSLTGSMGDAWTLIAALAEPLRYRFKRVLKSISKV